MPFPIWILLQLWKLLVFVARPVLWPSPGGIRWVHQLPRQRTYEAIAKRIFDHANTFRQQHGLAALKHSHRLTIAAWNHGHRMALTGEWDHVLSDGLDVGERIERARYRFSCCRENIAWSTHSRSVEDFAWHFHDGWVNSPGHRENLLSDDVTELGVAVVKSHLDGRLHAVQNFAAPLLPNLLPSQMEPPEPTHAPSTHPAPVLASDTTCADILARLR